MLNFKKLKVGTRYNLEILQSCGKRVETKSQSWELLSALGEVVKKEETSVSTAKLIKMT